MSTEDSRCVCNLEDDSFVSKIRNGYGRSYLCARQQTTAYSCTNMALGLHGEN